MRDGEVCRDSNGNHRDGPVLQEQGMATPPSGAPQARQLRCRVAVLPRLRHKCGKQARGVALPQSCRTPECGMRCCAEARGWGRLNPSGPWVPEPLRAFAPKNVQLNTKSPPGTGSRSWSGTGEAPTTCVVRSGERDKRLLRGRGCQISVALGRQNRTGLIHRFFSDTGSFD